MRTIRGLFVLTALCFGAAGCSSIEPWVKPYDRENLADPIMVFTRAPISQDFLEHVGRHRVDKPFRMDHLLDLLARIARS